MLSPAQSRLAWAALGAEEEVASPTVLHPAPLQASVGWLCSLCLAPEEGCWAVSELSRLYEPLRDAWRESEAGGKEKETLPSLQSPLVLSNTALTLPPPTPGAGEPSLTGSWFPLRLLKRQHWRREPPADLEGGNLASCNSRVMSL